MPTDEFAQTAISHPDSPSLAQELERLTQRVEELERGCRNAEDFAALAAHEVMAPLVMVEAGVAMAAHRLDAAAYGDVLEALGALGRGAARTRLVVETLLQESRAEHVL